MKHKYKKSKTLFFFSKCFSFFKHGHIDVVIPTTDKDLQKLSIVIPSLSNIQHHIDNIYLVAPKSEFIKDFCIKHGCIFIDENSVLDLTIKDIDYKPCGINRAGWIFQQLLKLNCDTFCKNEYILVADSDTVFSRKQYFIKHKKMVFDCSDEYHGPYFDAYKKLLGLNKRFALSFVAHHMLFKKSLLKEMKQKIEEYTHKKWFEAILDNLDMNETSTFSEYETYGNYMYYNHKNLMLLREWYNKSTTSKKYSEIPNKSKYKTISMHSYNEE
jgi:hypothetical protein